jgi:UDP-N-acetylmuramate--alanine ligase
MIKHVHLIGIGGYGISAIAQVLLEKGYLISGSDRQLSDMAVNLQNQGARIFQGHAAEQIQGADLIIKSSAIPENNTEVLAARQAGIPVQKRDEFLGNMLQEYKGIGIAGTHGKTTTTAMIAWMLTALDQDPSYIIGGISKNLGNNAHAGNGPYFVIEADEYDHMFLGLFPFAAIITNLEHDHPDCYPTPAAYEEAFIQYIHNVSSDGFILMCADDSGIQHLLKKNIDKKIFTYGLTTSSDYQAVNLSTNSLGAYRFTIQHQDTPLTEISLRVPGKHNVQNATAAIAMADKLGLDIQLASKAIGLFESTGRRFDLVGTFQGITIIDDYAHHPTEIKATLEAAKNRFPGQTIRVVWQPHTYSRTITLFDQFVTAFTDADEVIVTEVFASREINNEFTAQTIAAALQNPHVHFMPDLNKISSYLIEDLKSGDVLLVLTAGDADQISKTVFNSLQQQEAGL